MNTVNKIVHLLAIIAICTVSVCAEFQAYFHVFIASCLGWLYRCIWISEKCGENQENKQCKAMKVQLDKMREKYAGRCNPTTETTAGVGEQPYDLVWKHEYMSKEELKKMYPDKVDDSLDAHPYLMFDTVPSKKALDMVHDRIQSTYKTLIVSTPHEDNELEWEKESYE